ncbi:MAG: PspA/IM30 family protein [Deltaproteobacteria bacterium]|jgi:phage shock protein A|nr:PspA/IM30 family protein [Deltaproteobacteria bacterium]
MPNVFSRFADIISSNINAMLDKAENPSKMLKLIIGEMEDTLVEIKASTAQAMACQVHLNRRKVDVEQTVALWLGRAKQAVAKSRDDLARVALVEKKAAEEELEALNIQIGEHQDILDKHHAEIDQLENKIAQAREREKLIAMRQNHAEKSLKVSGQLKRYDLAASQMKLDRLDQRLDRLEAEAELERAHRRPIAERSIEAEFQSLDDSIELELQALKGDQA